MASSRLMRRDLYSICFSSALHTAARPGPRPRQRVWSAVNMGNRATFKAGCFGGCVLSVVFTTESTHHNPVSCARGKKINRHITLIYLLARDFNFKCLGLLTSGIGKWKLSAQKALKAQNKRSKINRIFPTNIKPKPHGRRSKTTTTYWYSKPFSKLDFP